MTPGMARGCSRAPEPPLIAQPRAALEEVTKPALFVLPRKRSCFSLFIPRFFVHGFRSSSLAYGSDELTSNFLGGKAPGLQVRGGLGFLRESRLWVETNVGQV